jgi:hypothetical protein
MKVQRLWSTSCSGVGDILVHSEGNDVVSCLV